MTTQSRPTFYFIGGGRAGASLAFYFRRKGYPVSAIVERNPDRFNFLKKELNWPFVDPSFNFEKLSQANVIFLTIHDDQIDEMANYLAEIEIDWSEKIVVHSSGAVSSEVLKPIKNLGGSIASVHPVYSFSVDPRENHNVKDIWFNLEGDHQALTLFENIFRFTENRSMRVTVDHKKAIHIACVFYANFYVALADFSREILTNSKYISEEVFKMLNPLLSSSIEQVLEHGTTGGLTGPIKRADIETITSHLKFLKENHQELIPAYILLSKKLINVSKLMEKDKKQILSLFHKYSEND